MRAGPRARGLRALYHAPWPGRDARRHHRDGRRQAATDLRGQTEDARNRLRTGSRGRRADWIVSSPLVRAVETAEIVGEALGSKPPLDICDALKPGGPPEALITFLAKRPNRRRVLVVGHEPDLSELAARLMGAGRNANMPFKKGGCCLITFSIFPPKSPGTLVWWLPPRIMRKFG